MGADVIKVEPADGRGDKYRLLGTYRTATSGERVSASFAIVNRGKRSIAVDSKSEAGRMVIASLVRQADIVVINQRPAAVKRQKLSYSDLVQLNPGLIYCEMNGFGSTGPLAGDKAVDPVIQAVTGTVAALARQQSQSQKHVLLNNVVMDKVTAMSAVQSILAALYARERHPQRRGQHIELAMLDAGPGYRLSLSTSVLRWHCCYKIERLKSIKRISRPRLNSGTDS